MNILQKRQLFIPKRSFTNSFISSFGILFPFESIIPFIIVTSILLPPEIAVVVMTENGGSGSYNCEVARNIIAEYFGMNATKVTEDMSAKPSIQMYEYAVPPDSLVTPLIPSNIAFRFCLSKSSSLKGSLFMPKRSIAEYFGMTATKVTEDMNAKPSIQIQN